MSEWFFKKLNLYIGWIAMAMLFVLTVFAASIEIKDLDIWLHLASGRFIVENFSIPHTDIFSATVFGKLWINHEWLFQVILYSVYALNGIEGLVSLQMVLVGVTFLLLLLLGYNRDRQVMPIITLFLVVLVYQLRFYLRPDIFSLLIFVLFIVILSNKLQNRASLYLLFVLQVLWVNIHGFFFLGPLLVLLVFVSELVKRRVRLPFDMNTIGRLDDAQYQRIKYIFIAVIAACFINPYFVKGALYPLDVFLSLGQESSVFFKHISELQRPFTFISFFDFGNYLFYKLLIVISALSFMLNYRRIDIGIFILWLFFLFFSMAAARNVAYFAFAAYLALLANAQYIHFTDFFSTKLNTPRLKIMCAISIKVILIGAMLSYIQTRSLRGYYDFDRYERKSESGGLSLRNYPYKAADFLIQNEISGRFFNDFNSGAYLIGRTFPKIKVFIDGRTELYGNQHFKEYNKAWKGDTKLFDELAEKYNLTGAFLNSIYVPAPEETIEYLYHNPEWKLIYFDYDASIFLRNIEENKEWIRKLEIDLTKRDVPKADFMKIKTARMTPYRYTNRAQALYHMGLYNQAKAEAQEALSISAADPIAFKVVGKVALKRKEYVQAMKALRHAKILNAGDIETRFYLAKSYYHLGQYRLAQEHLQRVLTAKADNPLALLLLSKIYQKLGQDQQALCILKKIEKLEPAKIKRYKREVE